jgi:membrane protease YdiL (CAAX protease family)
MSQEFPFDPTDRNEFEEKHLFEIDEQSDLVDESDENIETGRVAYRGSTSDPFFGFLIAIALSIGLTPLLPVHADLRYTLAWGALAGVSVLAWLLGNSERIDQEKPENLAWGIVLGALLGIPFLIFLREPILVPATQQIFPLMPAGTLLAYLVFVMPISETLFFRGLLQNQLVFWVVGLLATLWNIVLFFPVMWSSVLEFPAVAIVIVITLLMMNMIYVYVRERNGLAAAWICQIVANLLMLFIPFL